MARVLVINPNTTEAVTARVVQTCREVAPGIAWEGATAAYGAPYIASEHSYAVGAHAVLDAWAARQADGHAAVLIACFGDPGLLALRESAAVPVFGLAESSFRAAAAQGDFAVVTGGRAWGPMLERFARAHRLDAGLRAIRTVDLTGAQIAADPERSMEALAAACAEGVSAGGRCVLLGGAALTGLVPRLQPRVAVPVLDNVVLAAQAVAAALAGAPRTASAPAVAPAAGD